MVLNRYLSRPLSIFIFLKRFAGYRALARGILHIYTAADHRGAQRYSFLAELCDGKAEADFAVKRRFFCRIHLRLPMPAFEMMYTNISFIREQRMRRECPVFIFLILRTAEVRHLVIGFTFEANRKLKILYLRIF